MLVPHVHELDSIDISDVCWILVIEKEASQSVYCLALQCPNPLQATFQSLASTRFCYSESIGNGIIVTANISIPKHNCPYS